MTRQYIIEIDDADIIKLNNGHKIYRAKGFDTLVFNENGLKQLKTVSRNSSADNSGREEGYKEAMDTGVSYFSSWQFVIHDIPTVSYHIAKNTADFKGMNRVQVLHKEESNFRMDWETKTIAAYDEQSKTLRIMAYNYQETLNKVQELPLLLNIKAPQKSGKVTITTKYVNDDCNYFDEWLEDKETYNISNDMFRWSPDDPGIQVFLETADDELKNIYYEKMLPRYREAATLVPKESTAEIKDGKLTINDIIDGNSVVFYEIKF